MRLNKDCCWIGILLLVALKLSFQLQTWRGHSPPIVSPLSAQITSAKHRKPIAEPGWWTSFIQETARVYQKPTTSSSDAAHLGPAWCHLMDASEFHKYPPDEDQPRGLLYVKSHKASSSTCEGINFAIAYHVGRRKQEQQLKEDTTRKKDHNSTASRPPQHLQKCEHYNRHVFANDKLHGNVPPRKDRAVVGPRSSLLWTFVRHPTARDISHVYHFEVSGRGKDPWTQTAELLEVLEEQKSRQTKYLCPTEECADVFRAARRMQTLPTAPTNETTESYYYKPLAIHIQKQIFHHFDFIGVTERMTESLAVMTLLWDLDPTDVIVLSAKRAAGNGGGGGSGNNNTTTSSTSSYDGGGVFRGKLHRCAKLIQPSPLPTLLESYLHSDAHREGNADFLLYYAAVESLDRTIESLGRNVVMERVATLTFLQELVTRTCLDTAIFPCSSEGVWQEERSQRNCYVQDAGCGYPCVDKTLQKYVQTV